MSGEDELEYKLHGKTLQVYLHLIKSGVNESYGGERGPKSTRL
ncbi:MAG: hypothetical protein ACUVQ0_01645 [Thermoproteota archaeon]